MSTEFINFKKLSKRIDEVRNELTQLLHLESLLGTKPTKRGRKAGMKLNKNVKAKLAKGEKKKKRGSLGESILAFLAKKGEEGAHAKDIAAATGNPTPNVTAYFYGTGKKVKGVKKLGGNKFSYVPKAE